MVVFESSGLMGGSVISGAHASTIRRVRYPRRGPGLDMITAMWRDGESNYDAHQALDVGSTDVENVSLVISPGIQVNGRVRFEPERTRTPLRFISRCFHAALSRETWAKARR